MKCTLLSHLGLALALAACEGPDGPAGKDGAKGDPGAAGKNTLVKSVAEPAGANCPNGGVKIESGVDANSDGVLADSEVDAAQTSYVCNGGSGPSSVSTGLVVEVKSVTTDAASPVKVRFTVKDDRGFPVDRLGVYTVNTKLGFRFSLSYLSKDANGNMLPYTVLTKAGAAGSEQPTAFSPDTSSRQPVGIGTLVENGFGAGDYTYTFPSADIPIPNSTTVYKAVGYDAAKLGSTHVIWIEANRQTNIVNTTDPAGYTAVNLPYWFIPNNPTGTPDKREIVATANCNQCHRGFTAEGATSSAFHGSGRIEGIYCAVCHNAGHKSNPIASSEIFIHRIHNGEDLLDKDVFDATVATYPQDVRNCAACHAGAAQGDQWKNRPTKSACTSCHAGVEFVDSGADAKCTHPQALDSNGKLLPCRHNGDAATDDMCVQCHTPAKIAGYHQPIQPPDPNNIYLVPKANGGNSNTNAAFLAATGFVPAGAAQITYDIKSVTLDGSRHPVILFKFKKNGTDVVFADKASATEMMPGFIGAPSAYFAFSVPQDIPPDYVGAPYPAADFNARTSVYIKNAWNGSATNATMSATPDANGYYTITITGTAIPAVAGMLTGGIGYTYSLGDGVGAANATVPLTEIDLDAFPFTAGNGQGGLIVPAPDVYKVASGCASSTDPVCVGRRPIVDNAKCLTCHVTLGAAPTFHAGQRNNGPTCSFCHNVNQVTGGWSGNAKDFVHAIHGARKRSVDFTWHAESATENFSDVEFPGPLNECQACHIANDYDFTSSTSSGAYPKMLWSTVAQGKYNRDPATNPSQWFTISPYVTADNVLDYGKGFLTSGKNSANVTCTLDAPCNADPTTLVKSPIVAACSACHDTAIAIDHMQANGGSFYAPRSTAMAAGATKEQCLLCHGPNKIAAIAVVHQ